MKKMTLLLTVIITLFFLGCTKQSDNKESTVNAVLGDISFVKKFGVHPGASTDENLRIKTHLEYVENLLRNRKVSGLSPELQTKRKHLLELLHEYRLAGVFPRNYDYPDKRVPCFIDKDGRICAVGYLIEQTAGRKTAEEINRKYKYEKLLDIHDPTVDSWIAQSGLTKKECAMIQPQYGYMPPPTPPDHNHISVAYGIASSLAGGLNLTLGTMYAIHLARGTGNKTVPIIGLISGSGEVLLGSLTFPKKHYELNYTYTNESKKTLSIVNIGVGTATMILSSWNLLRNKPAKKKSLVWGLNSYPVSGRQVGLGLYIKKNF